MLEPIVLVHGGAGTIKSDTRAKLLVAGVKQAAHLGYEALKADGGTVLDAVETAVKYLEDNEHFNAGRGSVLNADGHVEMDASIMVGADLSAGAVTVLQDVQHPISVARMVMERTSHVLLAGEGAKKFAQSQSVPILAHGALVTDETRKDLKELKLKLKKANSELGTVGAVAIDSNGRLAVATSTGGRADKMVGRSSDTCMIGSGTYADDNIGGVSTTGHGETIAKFCLAHAIVKRMEQPHGLSAHEATNQAIDEMTKRLNNTAGAITISKRGDVGVGFSTARMSWAFRKGNEIHSGVDKNQHDIEIHRTF